MSYRSLIVCLSFLFLSFLSLTDVIAQEAGKTKPEDSEFFQNARSVIHQGMMRVDIMELQAPRRYTELSQKFAEAAKEHPGVLFELTTKSKPGEYIAYDERLGLTREEYEEWKAFGNPMKAVKKSESTLTIEGLGNEVFRISADGELAAFDSIEIDFANDRIVTPYCEIQGGAELSSKPDTPLGLWDSWRWYHESGTPPLTGKVVDFSIGKHRETGKYIIYYDVKKLTPFSKEVFFHILTFDGAKAYFRDIPRRTSRDKRRDVARNGSAARTTEPTNASVDQWPKSLADWRRMQPEKVVKMRFADPEGQGSSSAIAVFMRRTLGGVAGYQRFSKKQGYVEGELAPVADFDALCAPIEKQKHLSIIEMDESTNYLLIETNWEALGSAPTRGPTGFARGFNDELPSKDDPDYLKKLAELIRQGDHFQRKDAARALLEVEPEEIPSKEILKSIAKGFLELSTDPLPNNQELGVLGIIRFGGKHAAKPLIEYLQQARLNVPSVVYETLARYPSEEGAEAVAMRLGNIFDGDAPIRALVAMEGIAEQPTIEALHTNNPQAALAAIRVLKDIGSAKSLPALKVAQNAGNPQIEAAAQTAIRKVRERRAAASNP